MLIAKPEKTKAAPKQVKAHATTAPTDAKPKQPPAEQKTTEEESHMELLLKMRAAHVCKTQHPQ